MPISLGYPHRQGVDLGLPVGAQHYGEVLLGARTSYSFRRAQDEAALFLGYVMTRDHQRTVALDMGLKLRKLRESCDILEGLMEEEGVDPSVVISNLNMVIGYAMEELAAFWTLAKSVNR